MISRRLFRLSALLPALLSACLLAAAVPKGPPRDVLGVRPGMGEAEARALLDKAGREEVVERSKQNVWEVSDPRISHVIVRFNKDKTVRWVIAKARADAARRLRYSDVADPALARHKTDGTNHTYIWTVPPRGTDPGYVVVAGGSDPQFLTSYRILRTFE